MSKTKLHSLEKRIDLAAGELLDVVREYHEVTSGGALTNYAEIFGLAVMALEGINVTSRQRKRLVRRAGVKI